MLPLATFAASAAIGVGKSLLDKVTKNAAQPLDSTRSTDTTAAGTKMRKTADDFESMFLENSLQQMTSSEGTEGPLGENGTGGGVWRSMLTKEYAGQIVKSGGVGISNQIYSEMMKLQEAGRAGA